MNGVDHGDLFHFSLAGINYRKTDAAIRGQFAIAPEQYARLLDLAHAHGLHDLFILSTCNRTEIYGLTERVQQLTALLCTQTAGTLTTFNEIAYFKKGMAAAEHLFHVASGLDSQILGDYEIIGQLKQSVKFARAKGFIGPVLDRLVNNVLQASKAVKNQTALSGGTVSVSFAAVQYIKERSAAAHNHKILLLGTGKIGRNTCRNMVDYLGTRNITLINRTGEKARALAAELGLLHAAYEDLDEAVKAADIILVATNAATPTVLASHLAGTDHKLVIDLSIPYNVEVSAQNLPNVTLVNVDGLASLKDKTLQKRRAEVPRAKLIISEHIAEFAAWCELRRHTPVLKAVKDTLHRLHAHQLHVSTAALVSPVNITHEKPEARIQKVITSMAVKMRRQNQRGCQYIEAMNDFMATGAN